MKRQARVGSAGETVPLSEWASHTMSAPRPFLDSASTVEHTSSSLVAGGSGEISGAGGRAPKRCYISQGERKRPTLGTRWPHVTSETRVSSGWLFPKR